nr:MAG TPA: hypothetical protein [Caudoviricetes sp.]
MSTPVTTLRAMTVLLNSAVVAHLHLFSNSL